MSDAGFPKQNPAIQLCFFLGGLGVSVMVSSSVCVDVGADITAPIRVCQVLFVIPVGFFALCCEG